MMESNDMVDVLNITKTRMQMDSFETQIEVMS